MDENCSQQPFRPQRDSRACRAQQPHWSKVASGPRTHSHICWPTQFGQSAADRAGRASQLWRMPCTPQHEFDQLGQHLATTAAAFIESLQLRSTGHEADTEPSRKDEPKCDKARPCLLHRVRDERPCRGRTTVDDGEHRTRSRRKRSPRVCPRPAFRISENALHGFSRAAKSDWAAGAKARSTPAHQPAAVLIEVRRPGPAEPGARFQATALAQLQGNVRFLSSCDSPSPAAFVGRTMTNQRQA